MLPPVAFRRATEAALALAVVALGYVEYPLLPEVGWLAAAVAVSIGVIARVEERARLLSIPDANKLGAALGAGWAVWVYVRVGRESRQAEFTGLGWVQFAITLVGPLLMVLIPAMLLRRGKTAADYWQIYAAGLVVAVLAGAMTDDPAAVAVLAAAGGCGVAGLAHFAAARAGNELASGGREPPGGSAEPGGSRPPLARYAVGWAALAAAVAVPLYLATPRSPFGRFVFVKERVEVGFAADQMVDLTRTGKLRDNPEVAFEVRAERDDGSPKLDLPDAQRWRGAVLTHYERGGVWRRDQQAVPPAVGGRAARVGPGEWRPPDLGPDRYRLGFRVPAKLRSEFLAEPVVWAAGEPPPVADLLPAGPVPWYVASDGSFTRLSHGRTRAEWVEYVQLTRPAADPDLGTGFTRDGDPGIDRAYRTNPVLRVKEYADEVLRAAVREGRLTADEVRKEDRTRLPAEEHHEAVARELARHLSTSPGLKYTTVLKRENREVDPVEDFLLYSKAGHCERFATALVLMLRSQNVPAALILGFKGCDRGDRDGDYLVRQSHAHAWAEALVSRPAAGGRRVWHWLSLDPSPERDADEPLPAGDGLLDIGRAAFEQYVANYTAERRDEALRAAATAVARPEVWAGGGLVAAAAVAVWRLRRRRTRTAGTPAGRFGPLVATLARHGYAPGPGETPREFAARVGADLATDLPAEWVERYYQERFGGRPAANEEWARLTARLAEFDAALRSRT